MLMLLQPKFMLQSVNFLNMQKTKPEMVYTSSPKRKKVHRVMAEI